MPPLEQKEDDYGLLSSDGEMFAPTATKFDANNVLTLVRVGREGNRTSEEENAVRGGGGGGNKSPSQKANWTDGEKVTNCMNPTCLAKFTLTLRRHHCRDCGKVFCDDCCPKLPGKDRLCAVCTNKTITNNNIPTPRLTETGSFLLIEDFSVLPQTDLEKYFEDFMEEKGIMKKAREPMRALGLSQKVQVLTQEVSVLRAQESDHSTIQQ